MKQTKKIIILGGGVAGMSAAQELMERSGGNTTFEIEVYEKKPNYVGGKARSVNVPGTNLQHPDKYLPGEHGFRFFPGFYKHVTDTMSRIPFVKSNGIKNKNGVLDNLVDVSRCSIAQYGKKPIVAPVNFPQSQADLKLILDDLHAETGLTHAEKDLFASKIWQLMCSCKERRNEEYERLSWWEYMDADNQSKLYQTLLVEGLTRTLVAANARFASTKTGGDIFLQLIFNMFNSRAHTDRVLNGPTNDVWLSPWVSHLILGGVSYNYTQVVEKINLENGRISGAVVKNWKTGEEKTVIGDYYILATPVEAAANLISDEMIKYDAVLEGIKELAPSVAWMNGMQFFLNEDVPVVHGHCIYVDSPWALTSISQVQFWEGYDLAVRGNGKVKGILSIDISNWDQAAMEGGKCGSECTPDEIKDEVWRQLKESLNNNGNEVLRDDMIEFWYLDHSLYFGEDEKTHALNNEPLLVNTVNTWELRPSAYCRIPNLFFASDYVRTNTDLATMEGANEAARRAVNCILDDCGSDAEKCEIWDLHEPLIMEIFKASDKKRYDAGLPYKESVGASARAVAGWVAKELAKL